jgi:hypothetical protein
MRTYGQTRNCAGCRFWSEMIAKSQGDATVALCLSEGLMAGNYTHASTTCLAWKSGHFGAVDDPPNYGEETQRAYDAEERGR